MTSSSWRASSFVAAHLLASCLAIGCDDNVVVVEGTGGGSGGGDAGGGDTGGGGTTTTTSTTKPAVEPAITALRAPDRTTIRLEVVGVAQVPDAPSAYVLTSELGPLVIKAVELDSTGSVVLLQTEKQKLGVEYTLTIQAPKNPLDGLGGKLLAADTATFWATDFASFEAYEVVAERVGVGKRAVLYLEPGYFASDIDETIAQFDSKIYPIETELLHAAPDRDGNGRTVLLGLDGQQYYGGYFYPLDSLSEDQATQWGYHSNEMEILYLNVAALGGYAPDVVVGHEFGHLLYQEQHPFQNEPEYFAYHNEGLAECATHAVYGSNPTASSYYVDNVELATGKSLVQWEDGNYTQYAQAYVFWTYVAAQLGGVPGYREIFLSDGSPKAIENLLLDKLGEDFAEIQLRALTASWVQAPSGPYGFQGMLSLPGSPAQVPPGITSLQLAPFAAVFFPQTSNELSVTGAGSDVRFLGINGADGIDVDTPFDAAGGVVVALNGHLNWNTAATQSSGVLGSSMAGAKINPPVGGPRDLAWLHPPPLLPTQKAALQAWRQRTSGF